MSKKTHKSTEKRYGYEPSRKLDDFHLAGFSYYDGLFVIDELNPGTKVKLVKEHNNPYDPNAIAIYYNEHKLGFVPAEHNKQLSTFLYFGHERIFEARIQMKDMQQHPERQLRVVVFIKDKRDK